MERSITKDEVLDYLYRSKHCFEEADDESSKKYFLHCIMAVYNLALLCAVIDENEVGFYRGLFTGDEMCERERAIAEICDWGV